MLSGASFLFAGASFPDPLRYAEHDFLQERWGAAIHAMAAHSHSRSISSMHRQFDLIGEGVKFADESTTRMRTALRWRSHCWASLFHSENGCLAEKDRVGKCSDPQSRARLMGTISAGISAGILLSRFVGGVLAQWYGWRGALLAFAAFVTVSALCVIPLLPAERPVGHTGYF